MAEAQVVTSRLQLAEKLAAWPDKTGDMTWAVVACGALPTAAEMIAMKQAATLCDRVVCVRLFDRERPVAPKFAEIVRSAGADIVWVAKDVVEGPVRLDVGVPELGDGAAILLQAVTTVLPVLVVVPRGSLGVVRACRNIQSGLGDMFSLRIVSAD